MLILASFLDFVRDPGGTILTGFMKIMLWLDGIIYSFIGWCYEIFLFLAKLQIFNDDEYNGIVRRIYIVLGIIMLFALSYSLLKAVINPDDFAKGDNSLPNIIKNVVVSLVIIAVLPTVFNVAYSVQAVILNSHVITKLILNTDNNYGEDDADAGGRVMAATMYRAFFYFNTDMASDDAYDNSEDKKVEEIVEQLFKYVTLEKHSFLIFGSSNFRYYDSSGQTEGVNIPEYVSSKAITYLWGVSQVAGIFVLWCIVLFCFDLGIRVVKLIFYQLIAPVAVACRVMPGSKAKAVFGNWVKITVTTFLEVFIRVFIMNLGVYLITLISRNWPDIKAAAFQFDLPHYQATIAEAFIIMGIVAFIRQAPKLIQDIFGFDSGNLNLGLKGLMERAGNGGALAAAGLVGGVAGGFGRRLRDARAAGRSGLAAARSAIAGGIGGGRRAFMQNLNSKSMSDLRKNTTEGINETLAEGQKRDQYRAQFGGVWRGRAQNAKEFLGLGANVETYNRTIDTANDVVKSTDNIKTAVEDIINKNKTNAAFAPASVEYKGVTDDMIQEFNGLFQGRAIGVVEQEVAKMEAAAGKKDYVAMAKEELTQRLRAQGGFSEETIAQTVNSSIHAQQLERRAREMSLEDSERINQYKAMYNQLYKATVKEAANRIANGDDFGGAVKLEQVQDVQNLVSIAENKAKTSQLSFEHSFDSQNAYSSLDDIATEAKSKASDAARARQEVIQKQGKKQ